MGRAGAKLLAKEPSLEADFSKASAALSKARLNNVPRYLPNPEENWGPKTRHGRPLLGTSKVSGPCSSSWQAANHNPINMFVK